MWPAGVEVLTGDRSADLSPLDHRGSTMWDALVDTCAGVPADVPADVPASARAPGGCGSFLVVSRVPACATTSQVPVRETDALASAAGIGPDDRDPKHYGPQKAACEAEVRAAFGDRALIVRPGLIVGPGDRSGRFSHWPWRVAAGGEMLVPDVADKATDGATDSAADSATDGEPLQFIDVRDLGDWLVRLIEPGAHGGFHATGPVDAASIGWTTLLTACRIEADARGLTPANAVRVDEAFLLQHAVQP